MPWGKDWMYVLNLKTACPDAPGAKDAGGLTPYPLQFANCDRIEHNDTVYIFDEVGSGKTISAGLMAVHYLYNNPGQRALIITTHTLANVGSGSETSLFLEKLKDFRLKELGLDHRIDIISNHYSYINPKSNGGAAPLWCYGLVIIDEAQEFLNHNTERYKNLVSKPREGAYALYTLTERVVFLTATPIKKDLSDMNTYRGIAAKLLRKPFLTDKAADRVAQKGFISQAVGRGFSRTFPATRYFKDMVKSLAPCGLERRGSPRREFHLWTWDEGTKKGTLLRELKGLKDGGKNRFVIFVRLVADEAYALRDYLTDPSHDGCFGGAEVEVVTGANSGELGQYTGEDDALPRVLILNYQIAEVGVNLPGYNYIINYHIPQYPSSLEQRFGRIDRLDSSYQTVHVCYLLCRADKQKLLGRASTFTENGADAAKRPWLIDTNTVNFCMAIGTYLNGLLPYLPSRNALLDETVFAQFGDILESAGRQLEAVKRWDGERGAFEAYQTHKKNPDAPVAGEYRDIIAFCDEYLPENSTLRNSEGEFRTEVIKKAGELQKKLPALPSPGQRRNILDNPDQVFYYELGKDQEYTVQVFEMWDCIGHIWEDPAYRGYQEEFASLLQKAARKAPTPGGGAASGPRGQPPEDDDDAAWLEAAKRHGAAWRALRAKGQQDIYRGADAAPAGPRAGAGERTTELFRGYAYRLLQTYETSLAGRFRAAAAKIFGDPFMDAEMRARFTTYMGMRASKLTEMYGMDLRLALRLVDAAFYRTTGPWYLSALASGAQEARKDCSALTGIPEAEMADILGEAVRGVEDEVKRTVDAPYGEWEPLVRAMQSTRDGLAGYLDVCFHITPPYYQAALAKAFREAASVPNEIYRQARMDAGFAARHYAAPGGSGRAEIYKASLGRAFRAVVMGICEDLRGNYGVGSEGEIVSIGNAWIKTYGEALDA